MVHIYYHIYAIEGVESIIDEQIALIQKHFDFPYNLNIGISIAHENVSSKNVIEKIYGFNKANYKIRDIRCKGNEFTTLDLIEEDKNNFSDDDYIFYFHTKGASKQYDSLYQNIKSWRGLMNYFNVEKVKNVFKIFEKTEFNTYGVLYSYIGNSKLYSGNFWWAKADYIKTINLEGIKLNRAAAETKYIQSGKGFNPFSPYDVKDINHYEINFKREEYAK